MAHNKLTKKERKEIKRQEKLETQETHTKQQKLTTYTWWAVGIAVLFGLGFFFKAAMTPTSAVQYPEMATVTSVDHVRGASGSATLLVEYSDFQCPACATYHTILQEVLNRKGGQIQFVYRHFPLTQIHPNAQLAAQAAEAAGKQGKFWEMHDILFTRQTDWAEEKNIDVIFRDYAVELELDPDAFVSDMNAEETKQRVNLDIATGERVVITGTPTFFLNGYKLKNPKSVEDFIKQIETSAR